VIITVRFLFGKKANVKELGL